MLNILIVDDSMIIRKNLTKILTKIGHNVVYAAKNGVEAINMYESKKPDLITMDITMPDMNGIEAISKIIKIDPEAKAIMVTSHGQEDMVLKAIQAGALGYLMKPINEDKLIEIIGTIFPKYANKEDDNLLDELSDDIF